ncbi:MAG: D-alanine--D-serine ligase VanG [Lachnospiraceae bacterium]|nr:D-alanine--D-serine ligase VanG [Lachnospiraceae bacterium]
MQTEKKKIAVLFGGCSSEYGVSLQSAHAVITHINREKYEPVLIGITREGKWLIYRGQTDKILENTWEEDSGCVPVVVSPDRQLHGLWIREEEGIKTLSLDAAFPVLHGKNGEDGTVQGVLELAGIPIVGCNVLASALCMDKDMAHRMAAAAGVKVPASVLLTVKEKEQAKELAEELGYPVFVKPLRAGSSFGITKVMCEAELEKAVKEAFAHDSLILMEQMIEGFEVGCAVMGDEELTIGVVDEIELSEGFFDYTEKYTLKTSSIHVPARISSQKAEEIKRTAGTIYRALRCSGFSRVDMFLTPTGEIYFNEVNTIPGFTSHSRFPNMMKGIGLGFAQIVNDLIGQTLQEM